MVPEAPFEENEAYARFPELQPTQYRDGWL
jgi:hypothetical protein